MNSFRSDESAYIVYGQNSGIVAQDVVLIACPARRTRWGNSKAMNRPAEARRMAWDTLCTRVGRLQRARDDHGAALGYEYAKITRYEPGMAPVEVLRCCPGDADWAKALATDAGQRGYRGE